MSFLHDYLEALHEPERREISFIKNVPLDDETTTGKILTWTDGTKVSPAQYRLNILEEISSNPNLSSAEIRREPLFFTASLAILSNSAENSGSL